MNIQLDYEFNASAGEFKTLQDREHFISSLSILLEWSPFSTEAELLQQARPIFFFFFFLIFSMQPILSTLYTFWLLGLKFGVFHECDIPWHCTNYKSF